MGKKLKATVAAIAATGIATLAALYTALTVFAAPISAALATVAYGGAYRPISGGHFNKRGGFVAALTLTAQGDGTFDTLKANMRALAVPMMRAEVAYAVGTGDVAYFRARKGGWCVWARGLLKGDALNADVTDDDLYNAYAQTCPTNPANVGGMLGDITLAAVGHNVVPLPVFTDTVRHNRVTFYDADRDGTDGYQSKGYGHATFTLAPAPIAP